MSKDQFFSDSVEVRKVRRRLSHTAAMAARALVVWPIVGAMLLVASLYFVDSVSHLTGGLYQAWRASWFIAAPIAMMVSLVASLRRKLRIESVSVRDGELRLSGGGARKTYRAGDIEGALVVEQLEVESEAEIALESGDVLMVRTGGGAPALVESLGFAGTRRRTVVPLGGARVDTAAAHRRDRRRAPRRAVSQAVLPSIEDLGRAGDPGARDPFDPGRQ